MRRIDEQIHPVRTITPEKAIAIPIHTREEIRPLRVRSMQPDRLRCYQGRRRRIVVNVNEESR